MLSTARDFLTRHEVPNVSFALADAEDLPFADGRFDLVTCRIAAHHFPHPERFLSEAARVLRPGGLLLLQDQVGPPDSATALYVNAFERRRDPSHVRALSEAEWVEALMTAGLELETIDRFEKQMALDQWAGRQGGTSKDLSDLQALLTQAPKLAREWMRPGDLENSEAEFVIHHCLFSARRPTAGRP
jgi:ubiquinone/menaquinone biosynthesis C-methylase UbiE